MVEPEVGDEASNIDSISVEDFKQLQASMSSMETKFETLMAFLQSKENPTPTPEIPPADANPTKLIAGFVSETGKKPIEEEEEEDVGNGSSTPKRASASGKYSEMPPPQSYTPDPIIPMPHFSPVGPPPMLDASSFANWQFLMRSHVCSSLTELWRIF